MSGRIVGTVQDRSKAIVPNVKVSVINQETNITAVATTNAEGQFRIENLQPGNYRVRFDAPGFRPYISNGNTVVVDNATQVNAILEVGSKAETIEVTAATPLIDTTSSSMGQVISQSQIESLPLNGRIFSQLVQTVPGSVATGFGSAPESAAGAGATTAISASVNGLPWAGTTYTLDGVSNMELLNGFINITPPLDSLQEVKASLNNADATVGTYGGAQVNAILKSGTNVLHGSAYEYFRSDSLNAYQWRATTKAPYRSNQFGGSFGGPISPPQRRFSSSCQ
ncbi:MAG: carboxypeptidase regulatory-like domain-containing protein [Acidobacteria bacterium]|nr:carboxypeptidase regulatory-like domain-containing protein [Acidobacteriota bacterium]